MAVKTLQKAFQLSKKIGDRRKMSICLSNIGCVYMRMNNPAALRYLCRALEMVKDENIDLRASILQNIGRIYVERSELDKALKHFEEALALAHKIKSKHLYCQIWLEMGRLYFVQKKYSQAIDYAQKSLRLSKEIQHTEEQRDSYELLSELYSITGVFKDAYLNHVQYRSLSDSLFNKKNIRKMALIESTYKHDKEKQVFEMEKVRQSLKIENQKQIILFLGIVSVFILMLAFTVYWFNKLKKKVLNLEIETINHELETNQRAMTAAALKLVQNAERDTYCIKMLENIKKNTMEEGQKDITSLVSDYKLRSYTSNWDEFEVLFEKVNATFYDKLNERFPTLTPNERKLCVFLKLNMSNKHISQITFQSEEALKKARLRLRKKLDLDRDTNLTTFIQNL